MPTIQHQIAELQQIVRERQTEAARPGKGQELAKLRLERTEAALSTLIWCKDNADRLRAFEAHNPTSKEPS